jgi:hypothetical protein
VEERGEERFDVFEDFLFSAIPEEKRELIMDILEADMVSVRKVERNYFRAKLRLEPKPVMRSFPLRIDNTLSLKDRLALGRYALVNENVPRICSVRQLDGCDEKEVALLHLGTAADSNSAVTVMHEQGLESLSYVELLAFAIQYPEVVRSLPVVALKPIWDPNGRYWRVAQTAVVSGGEKGVMLGLPPFDGNSWHSDDHYLVRKRKVA